MLDVTNNYALMSLIGNIKDFILIQDLNGKILTTNPALESFIQNKMELISGYSSRELLDRLGINLLHNGSIEIVKQMPLRGLEYICKDKNGNNNHISWSFFPLLNSEQLIIGLILVGEDITKSKELTFQIERLDNIIRYAPDWIYWKDKNSIHLGCNNLFASAAGLQNRNEIIGKSDHDLPWHTHAAKYNLDDKEVINSGEPKLNIEDIVPLGNNKQVVVITNKVPLRDRKGNIIGVMGIATDITKRKAVEEALYKARATISELERLNNIIKYAPDMIYWKDKNSIHLGCNNQFAIAAGFADPQEVIGKSDYDFPWHDQARKYNLDDKEVIESGEPKLDIEDIMPFKNGKQSTVITNKVPLRDSNGKVIGVLGIATDITERKNIEKRLQDTTAKAEAASHAKSEFIANMSHDIRVPLAGILGLTEGLIDTADNTLVSLQQIHSTQATEILAKYQTSVNQLIEVVQEDGQLVLASADELLQLLNEILEAVRLESGKVSEKAESFDLRELVTHNIELTQAVARHRGLELISEIDEHIPQYFIGLRNFIDRSMLNLLSNGLKFTDKGFVKLKVELPEHSKSYHPGDNIELIITIQDTGIGIPQDKFETIFEHFSRLTPSYQGIYKGTGLGLFTVNRYIAAMGASIVVESEVGKGTRFIITLPLIVSDHSDREKSSYRAPKPKALARIAPISPSAKEDKTKELAAAEAMANILIVEDNSIAARAVQSTITRAYSHCACDKAENGKKAVKMAEENCYDFILMDIGLPDIDGIEATRQIRALDNPQRAKVPIVALTGHGSEWENKGKALAAGMQDVLAKPLSTHELESLMQQYVFNPEEKLVSLKEAETTKAEAQILAPVIDWPQCLEQYNGDEELVRDLLSDLANDLKMSQEKLAKAYKAHDDEALRTELHRVRGGVVCLSLPQLDKALAEFHGAVKDKPQSPKQLEKTYKYLQKAMKAFWNTLEKA
jgi:two-component system, OmpR family, aerobic respiration control sensor histidine kinase ArcB